jgi:hypothetical protein
MNLDTNQIVVFNSSDGEVNFDVHIDFDIDTVWLTQSQISSLFKKDVKTISEHIQNIFTENELEEDSTIRNFQIVQKEGTRNIKRSIKHYNLDVIIGVGYRVKSKRGIEFRKWVTKILKQYMSNGIAINDHKITELEKKLTNFSKDLKKELQEIFKELRSLKDRPINIYNQIQIGSDRLENKIIEALDQIIISLDKEDAKKELIAVKKAIPESKNNPKAMNKVKKLFKDIGDSDSDTNKALQGAGITKSILSELLKMLKELI